MQRSVEGLRVTPWTDWLEWWELKEMLETGNVKQANERVQSYLIRRRQAVPVAMVSTVSLRYQLEYPSPDEYSQRLGLAMALVRFVNGMTDRLQPRGEGAFAKSVYSLAVELKLPLILVEIRHQASHNSLPRLTALESGARKALVWLEEYYWNAQYEKIRHNLENTPQGLKPVFARDSESESPSLETCLSEDSLADEGCDTTNEQDANSVLGRLKALSNSIVEGRRKAKNPITVEAERAQSSEEQWGECGNCDLWKTTPIGLIPGQKQAPRWQTKSTEKSADVVNPELGLNLQETSCHDTADMRNLISPNKSQSPRKLVRQCLSTREAEKVNEMASYYEQLLKSRSDI